MKKVVISTMVSGIILFLLGGLAQFLPWGIPSTQNISVQSELNPNQRKLHNLTSLAPGELTTEKFDAIFLDKISTYSTDHTFSWIVTQPLPNDYTSYFIREIGNQLIVGLLLSLILYLTIKLDLKTRLTIILIVGFAASVGTYGQLMNWWNVPVAYGAGVSINLIIGWIVVSWVVARFIMKSEN